MDSVSQRFVCRSRVLSCRCVLPLQLWGTTEQMKLLKLLIALEEFEMAAEGFAVMKVLC
jgi:hypothetical protein